MTLARSKQSLLELLADTDNHVIALSGKWGTGKSHLWSDVQKTSVDKKIENAVYASLFGLSSIAELKLKIAEGVIQKLDAGGKLVASIRATYTNASKVLKRISPRFSALDELAQIAAPMMIKDYFIVIDDIERKHDELSIDEILGFIDDCVQNLNCRVLLILNSDRLTDKDIWEVFREKVIDQELRLDTSPAEAFDIAAELTKTAYAEQIKPAVEACQITNIRIIRKIIRVVNHLLANRVDLPPQVLNRVIPSAALLSAIHYKGLEDGPDFDFVLNFQNILVAMAMRGTNQQNTEGSVDERARERWRLLFDKLGIRGTDEFEALVVDYLKSGLIESAAVRAIVDRYLAEGRELEARASVEEFLERCVWHPEVTEAELVAELRAIVPNIGLLDMYTVTSLHNQAMRFTANEGVAEDLINAWLVAFRQRDPSPQFDQDSNYFRRALHPAIEQEIRAALALQETRITLLAVCKRVREQRSWGTREEVLMKSVTPAEYEVAIRVATGNDLKLLLLQSMDLFRNREAYESHFGGGPQSFRDACRAIVQGAPNDRLSRLIRDLFRDAGIESEIDPAAPANDPGASDA